MTAKVLTLCSGDVNVPCSTSSDQLVFLLVFLSLKTVLLVLNSNSKEYLNTGSQKTYSAYIKVAHITPKNVRC